MSRSAKQLLEDVLALSERERARIVTEVLASLDGPPDANWQETWLAEIERRQRAASQRGEPAPEWTELRAKILARLASE